uniref:(California timema) hypothetical protein n=1 Tax=Timema californicum TaxID=61474 RepID=A0A7R9J8Y0_TIMCA|nr:unnamed protein product [Timema californicum]
MPCFYDYTIIPATLLTLTTLDQEISIITVWKEKWGWGMLIAHARMEVDRTCRFDAPSVDIFWKMKELRDERKVWALIQTPCCQGNYDEYGSGTSMANLTYIRLLHHPIVEMDGASLGSKDIVYNECRLDSLIVLNPIGSSKKESPLYHLEKYQFAMKFG